ncbi:SDR family NAD(P)-dependent oxidoreductase [Frankia sp. AgB32]|nr:SDR family NAD(P)-dependent oxidoreductase [Frankia sp. AgB32]MCK9897811.1 SDR family NAD(P)-dependent oxidoreductase [Frankia sp. AgB32]
MLHSENGRRTGAGGRRSRHERYGQVDILFLNAGVAGGGNPLDDEITDWHRIYDINFFGVVDGIKAFAPRMIAQGTPGHILGTSSGSGVVGAMYQTPAYSSSKSAVCTLMECLHGQLRDRESLIRAHLVLPPLTRTNLAGDPETMSFVQKGLEAGGAKAVLAEPEGVATTALEAIRSDSFWAHHARLTGRAASQAGRRRRTGSRPRA